MGVGQEIELKLEIAESAIPALLKSDVLKRHGIRFRPPRRLVTAYYDSAKGALRKKGIFLRIREDGRRITQTVKTAGESGVLAERGEWDWPLKTPQPDLEKAAETGLKPLAKRARKNDVKPVFASDLSRRIALLTRPDATLELALDQGVVRAGRRTSPLAELEIEVKAGAPAAVFGLARDLLSLPGIRIAIATKAARGFALASGRPLEAVKADGLDLSPEMTVAQAEASIIRSCAVQIAANLPAVLDKRMPEGIHQMRVALRRLRAALSLFKETMPAEERKALRRQSGALAKVLGPARDLDVLMAGPLKEAVPPAELAADLKALTARLGRARRQAWEAALAAVAAPEFGLLVLDLAERAVLLDGDAWPGAHDTVSLEDMAREALHERYRIVLALGQSIDTLSVLQRHELRLALKKLRYAADFFSGLYPKKDVRSGLKNMAGLQDALGGFNDAASAAAILDTTVAATPPKSRPAVERAALFLKGWASHRADQAWAHARESWEDFAGKKPFWH
jgi:inorganic triphosphatase YgiF